MPAKVKGLAGIELRAEQELSLPYGMHFTTLPNPRQEAETLKLIF